MTAQPIDGAGQGELRRAQTLDEVAAAALARLLERAQRPVGRAEAAFGVLGQHAAAGDHPVAVELGEDIGGQAVGGGRLTSAAPATSDRLWSVR